MDIVSYELLSELPTAAFRVNHSTVDLNGICKNSLKQSLGAGL